MEKSENAIETLRQIAKEIHHGNLSDIWSVISQLELLSCIHTELGDLPEDARSGLCNLIEGLINKLKTISESTSEELNSVIKELEGGR